MIRQFDPLNMAGSNLGACVKSPHYKLYPFFFKMHFNIILPTTFEHEDCELWISSFVCPNILRTLLLCSFINVTNYFLVFKNKKIYIRSCYFDVFCVCVCPVLGDANFPSASVAKAAGTRVIHCDGHDIPTLLTAILQLMPLDKSDDSPVISDTTCLL